MKQTYRKDLDYGPESEYFIVELGRLDELNEGGCHRFTNDAAASLFGFRHKRKDPHRDVRIQYPDGRAWYLTSNDEVVPCSS